ncbi:COX assembly mitochondrial protein homolog isoform X1 [Neodiprion lecontei]|uniref:COX assembly mitochondrial protein n=1 Tax=Neodiprion lecontei TaxID=441921 RepID=A0ABM3FCM5_NEOLC|nr:COX assembly mitochondrial protein homolog isoform X1 [Neodiprion lecontei]
MHGGYRPATGINQSKQFSALCSAYRRKSKAMIAVISTIERKGRRNGRETRTLKKLHRWTSRSNPDDLSLRKLELQVLIPKRVRERSRKEKCVKEVEAFSKCCSSSGFLMVTKCRNENSEMKECLTKWFNNPEFVEECKQEYLAERSEYRRTGIGKGSRAPVGTNRIGSNM